VFSHNPVTRAATQEHSTLKEKAHKFVSHKYFVSCMLIATAIALFCMDLWELCGPPPIERDLIIYAVMFVTFLLFLTEFSIMTWCKDDYRFSFFWGLDFLAMASLIPDAMMLLNVNIISLLGDSQTTLRHARKEPYVPEKRVLVILKRDLVRLAAQQHHTRGRRNKPYVPGKGALHNEKRARFRFKSAVLILAARSITRAGRAARAGTRAVRIIEVVKKQLKAREMKKKGIHVSR
jgi:hypothetical protein